MASLCRMCGDKAEIITSLLDTSRHHLQWAINRFDIELDVMLPTSVCVHCDEIIRQWTLFLSKREKANSLFSTMIANNQSLLHQLTSDPSNTSVPSKQSTSRHSAASAPDLSLPQYLVNKYHIKDLSSRVPRLSDLVLDYLQQNHTVDCNVVDNHKSEQRNVRIKLEPVTVDPCVCDDQVPDNLQQNLSGTVDDDDIEVPFEAIYDPFVKCEPYLVKTEKSSDLSANQYENHHLADNTAVTVKQEVIGNAEADPDVQPDLPELETSPETSNPGSNKDINIRALVFSCALCNFTTNCKSKITSHIVNQHVKMSRYQCKECCNIFKYKRDLHLHINHVHPNKCSYKCPLCNRGYKLKKYFNAHMINHDKYMVNHDKIFQCDVCGKILRSKQALTEHKMTIHTKSSPLSCNMCSKICYTDRSLKKHTREVHSNLSYKCDICDKSFKLKSHLRAHQQCHASVRAFSCNQCEKTFVTKFTLKQHSVIHSNLCPFKCEKCGLSFTVRPSLLYHICTVHSTVRAFKCHLCGKSFKSKGGFRKHVIIRHSDVRNYKCEQCGKQFKTMSELNQHLSSHSEMRPFVCAQCDKKFKCKRHLVRHLSLVHSDLRPFSCDKCSHTCKYKSNLNKHQLVHSKVACSR